jgi:hypothetical protein
MMTMAIGDLPDEPGPLERATGTMLATSVSVVIMMGRSLVREA